MIECLEALIALSEQGTMQRVAKNLFITQSAVSKRIAQLEEHYREKLIKRAGRKVVLTQKGHQITEKSRALVADYHQLLNPKITSNELSGIISLDISMSALMSFGASVLAKIKKKNPKVEFQVSIYHSAIAIERIRSSSTSLAIVLGSGRMAPDLIFLPLRNEQFVIIPSGLKPFNFKNKGELPIIALEAPAQDWMIIEEQVRSNKKNWGTSFNITKSLQSFSAIALFAKAGLGHGLVPHGVAISLGIRDSQLVKIPKPGISIALSLIAQQNTMTQNIYEQFYRELLEEL